MPVKDLKHLDLHSCKAWVLSCIATNLMPESQLNPVWSRRASNSDCLASPRCKELCNFELPNSLCSLVAQAGSKIERNNEGMMCPLKNRKQKITKPCTLQKAQVDARCSIQNFWVTSPSEKKQRNYHSLIVTYWFIIYRSCFKSKLDCGLSPSGRQQMSDFTVL